jgi:hypothetical protein
LKGVPFFIAFLKSNSAKYLTDFIATIKSIILEKNKNVNFKIMIDNEESEVKALDNNQISYILCKFHFIKSIFKNLNDNKLPQKDIQNIFTHIYQMYNSKTEDEYKISFENFEKFVSTDFKKFYEYFVKIWVKKYKNWTR